ncbi:MAG TPA: cation:proton antiporter [Gammaproteobacteria bacterium]|nr:cation:proton antiporter [Gammaproteobacteria bacterium]
MDPVAPVLLGVTGILFFAVLGRYVARKLGQPSVLGELLMGMALGNGLYYLGFASITVLREGPAIFDMVALALQGHSYAEAAALALPPASVAQVLSAIQGPDGADILKVAETVDVFSRYGVIFLLFLVGLDTSVAELRRVGGSSLKVAVAGVLLPFVLGFITARLLMPEASLNTDLFIAATLGATSIGITARVLRDLGQLRTPTSHIILGAAIIDDILGLIMLAVVSGIIVSGGVSLSNISAIIALSALFLAATFVLGPHFLRLTIGLVRHLDVAEAKLFISFLFVMALAWFANLVGLATIVGAFAAGVILHDAYFKHWGNHHRHRASIRDLVQPIEAILAPIFFVLMGIQVKLESFFDAHVVLVALGLLITAVAGKIAAGCLAGRGAQRLAIGIGMVPRGEVGLIFASVGKSLGVINDALFSAVVLMVIITTIMTPPLLKRALAKPTQQDKTASR